MAQEKINLIREPLSPGDLVDRAIRLYRENFLVFILAAAPPVLIAMVVMLGWWTLARLYVYRNSDDLGNIAHFLFIWIGNLVIWSVEAIAMLVVMGGASRNFVRHILFSERLSVLTIYKNVLRQLVPLLIASTTIFLVVGIIGGLIIYFGTAIGIILALIVGGIFSFAAILAFPLAIVIASAAIFFTFWLFFLVASRFAYVPQIITVEELGPFAAIGRSATLAGANVRRFATLFLFTIFATYSALAILYVPLGWYAWFDGIPIENLMIADPDVVPLWYEVAGQVISQLSIILLAPVWLIGLCLLYIDERARSENYDLELLARQRLGEIPDVPDQYMNPLRPALGTTPAAATTMAKRPRRQNSILGLED